MLFRSEKYVLLTTFRRDGRPVSSPVWIAPLDGTGSSACFTTGGDSGKVKRIRHTPRVLLQPCDVRGRLRPGTQVVEGTARVVTGDDYRPVTRAVGRKYGLQFRLVHLWGAISGLFGRQGAGDAGIVIDFG